MSDYPVILAKNGNEYIIDDIKYRRLSNGAIFDMGMNKIVGMDINGDMITRENASAYAKKRWKEGRIAANLGLQRLNNSESALDAWSDIIEQQALTAMGEGRDATNAAKFVGNATGLIASQVDYEKSETSKTDNVRIDIPADVIPLLLQALEKVKREKIEVIDIDPT